MHRPPEKKRAFVLILVLVMILLITVLAITYLRVMRMRTLNTSRSGGNIDLVADSVLNQALDAIALDMPVKNSGQENYDFPWTDASVSLMPATLSYPALTSGLFTKGRPARDDAWLASSLPEGGVWPHLTNLAGSFLDVTTSDLTKVPVNPATQLRVPSDKLSDALENGIPFGDPRLVDANGDGIGDSLWFYPARSQIETTRYVAAVYIEDLSAKLNLNTALPLRVGGAYGTPLPKGVSPSEVDLAALVGAFGATNAQLAAVTQYRSLGDATAAPWNAGKRAKYWGNRGSKAQLTGEIMTTDTARYGVDDEFELRFHGGINDHHSTTAVSGQKTPVTTPVEAAASGLPAILRATNTTTLTENTWAEAGFASADAFLRDNPRNWVTTQSGQSARQTGLDTVFLAEELRYNLNIQNPAHLAATVGDTVNLKFFRGPDGLDGTADDYPIPAGFARFVPLATERPGSMSYQWLCNLIDARDTDNLVTRMGDAAGGWYGFEPLPLLSEVYMQRAYREASGVTTVAGGYLMHCDSQGRQASYAFELANPYHFPIKLTNVRLAVQLPAATPVVAGGPYVIATDLTAAAWTDRDADGDPVLKAGHRLILWRNSATADANSDISAMVTAAVGTDLTMHKINCGMVLNEVANTGNGFMRVDLLCSSADKNGANVQAEAGAYSTITVPWLAKSFNEKTSDASVSGRPAGTVLGIRQVNGRAFGTNLNLLQCRPARWPNLSMPNLSTTTSGTALGGVAPNFGDTDIRFTRVRDTYDPAYQNLGKTTKVALPAGRADLANDRFYFNQQALAGNPRVPGNQLGSLMDLIRIPAFGPRARSAVHRGNLTLQNNSIYVDTTFASALFEMLEDGTKPLASLCISIDPGTSAYSAAASTTSHKNVPFGWLLPCLYDTLNPASDGGLDVDGDGAKDWFSQGGALGLDANANGILDWPSEVEANNYLIPGSLNLNTAPAHLLAESLPIADADLRLQLANAIVARRNGAPAAGTRTATDRGLSSTFEVLQDAATLPAFAGNPASRFDLAENFGCLPQTTACRSDFFAVHILVLGFDSNDFSTGPIEQRRVLVIVSRAPLTTNNKGQLKYWSYTY